MSRILITLAIVFSLCDAVAQDRLLVGGASSDKIAIINKQTEQIEWSHEGFGEECGQCNSLIYLDNGDVLYAHKSGAYMINAQKEMIWELGVKDGEELQCVSEIKGGYMVGIAGVPMRILEVDRDGRITKEVSFDTGVDNIHRQFRQIAKSRKGSYVIPISMSKRLVEIDSRGELKRDVSLENSSLYVLINRDGDWIATTGHAGDIYKIDSKSGEIETLIKGKNIDNGAVIEFGAGVVQLKNGNYMLANWVGHKGDQTQPILIEFNDRWEVVWSMNKIEGYTYAAAIYPIY